MVHLGKKESIRISKWCLLDEKTFYDLVEWQLYKESKLKRGSR